MERLNTGQPSNALVLTRKGIRTIKDVNINTEIWSELGWTKITNKIDNGIQPVYRFVTTTGEFLGSEETEVFLKEKPVPIMYSKRSDVFMGFAEGKEINQSDVDYGLKFLENRKSDIPNEIYFNDESVVRGFLKGILSYKAYLNKEVVRFCHAKEKLCRQIQTMLNSVGIPSHLSINQNKRRTYYELSISTKLSFSQTVGFIQEERNEFIREKLVTGFAGRKKNKKTNNIKEKQFVKLQKIYKIEVEQYKNSYWSNSFNVSG